MSHNHSTVTPIWKLLLVRYGSNVTGLHHHPFMPQAAVGPWRSVRALRLLASLNLKHFLGACLSCLWHSRRCTCWLFYRLSLTLDVSCFLMTKFRLCILSKTQMWCWVCCIRRHRMPIWSLTGDNNLDRFQVLHVNHHFPFVINNYLLGDTLRLLISCFSSYFCLLILVPTGDSAKQ